MVTFEWPEGMDHEALQDAVSVTTSSLSRQYCRYGIESSDIRQELWLWAMGNTKWLQEWLCREDDVERRMGYAALTKSLRRAGERYCRKEKAASLGYETRDEVFYDEGLIKSWLEVRANGVGVLLNQDPTGKIKSNKAANEGWNVEATVSDIDRALDVLDPEQQWILTELYGQGVSSQVLAEYLGVTRQAVEARAQRALRKMVNHLGGRNPW